MASARRLERVAGFRSEELDVPGGPLCNPSVTVHDGKLLVAARRPAYELDEGGYRLSPGNGLRGTTLLLAVDDRFEIERMTVLDTTHPFERVPEARDGLEDPRLFVSGGRLHCLWTALDAGAGRPTGEGRDVLWRPDWTHARNTMVVAPLDTGVVGEPTVLRSPTGRAREKNWMPFSGAVPMTFAYFLSTGHYVRLSGTAGRAVTPESVQREPGPPEIQNWFGSSQLIPWRGGWLGVVHRGVRNIPLIGRFLRAFYIHRLVELDEQLRVVGLSRPFYFLRRGIEFCAGIAAVGDDIVLSFGSEDRRAFLAAIPDTTAARLVRRRAGGVPRSAHDARGGQLIDADGRR